MFAGRRRVSQVHRKEEEQNQHLVNQHHTNNQHNHQQQQRPKSCSSHHHNSYNNLVIPVIVFLLLSTICDVSGESHNILHYIKSADAKSFCVQCPLMCFKNTNLYCYTSRCLLSFSSSEQNIIY